MVTEKTESSNIRGRIVRLKLVDGTLINGQVNIAHDPGYDRVSDLVRETADSFLVLFNATLYDRGTENSVRHKTLFVNKTHILWIEPDEEQK